MVAYGYEFLFSCGSPYIKFNTLKEILYLALFSIKFPKQ